MSDKIPRFIAAQKAPPSKRGHLAKKHMSARMDMERRGINLLEQILDDISQVPSAASRANLLIRLMPYIYPTLAAIKLELSHDEVKQDNELSQDELLNKVKLILLRKDSENEVSRGSSGNEGSIVREVESVNLKTGGTSNAEGYGSIPRSGDKE